MLLKSFIVRISKEILVQVCNKLVHSVKASSKYT